MDLFFGLIVLAFGIFLVVLAFMSFFAPLKIAAFLGSFAETAKVHFLEIGIRILIGTALIFISPKMLFSTFFYFMGWILVLTSIGLMIMPWRVHRDFSRKSVPPVIGHLKLFALAALAFGGLVFYGLSGLI